MTSNDTTHMAYSNPIWKSTKDKHFIFKIYNSIRGFENIHLLKKKLLLLLLLNNSTTSKHTTNILLWYWIINHEKPTKPCLEISHQTIQFWLDWTMNLIRLHLLALLGKSGKDSVFQRMHVSSSMWVLCELGLEVYVVC